MYRSVIISLLSLSLGFVLWACDSNEKGIDPKHADDNAAGMSKDDISSMPDTLQSDYGVNQENKVLSVGVLNDESGPAAAIGKPYANGKRLLAALVNSGESSILPKGWTVELVERDHAYNPQKSVQAYKEIKDQVLYFGTSFGTPNTLPLLPMLKIDDIVVFPASLSSDMAANEFTPPSGPSYRVEAMRAMDFAVSQAGDASAVKAGIVYQQDDYGKDGLDGWKAAAAHAGVTVVSEQTITPGQKDVTAVIAALKKAGATHVLLTTLPSGTGPILGTAAQLKYMPTWLGSTPSWIDAFFSPEVIPAAVFTNYHWVTGFPYWGEQVPGMDAFLAAWETHGKELGKPDFYTLFSFVQGMLSLNAFSKALAANDVTRSGYRRGLSKVHAFDAGGMLQPLDYSQVPYQTGSAIRVLKPDMTNKTWTVAADYATPSVLAVDTQAETQAAPPAPEGGDAPAPAAEGDQAAAPAAEGDQAAAPANTSSKNSAE